MKTGSGVRSFLFRLWSFETGPALLVQCCHCRGWLTRQQMTVEHLRPKALGGDNGPLNILPSCAPCNNRRPCVDISEQFRQQIEDRMDEVFRRWRDIHPTALYNPQDRSTKASLTHPVIKDQEPPAIPAFAPAKQTRKAPRIKRKAPLKARLKAQMEKAWHSPNKAFFSPCVPYSSMRI